VNNKKIFVTSTGNKKRREDLLSKKANEKKLIKLSTPKYDPQNVEREKQAHARTESR
jgi:hypothetical protein